MAPRLLSIAAAAVSTLAHLTQALAASRHTYIQQALNATDIMTQRWYNETSGQFDQYWWQTASIISTLADLSELDEGVFDHAHYYFRNTYVRAPHTNKQSWLNEYYDDEGWWALAWIKVYDMTKEESYLNTAKLLFEDMTGGLGADCGGIWWTKDKTYTATIANQLFFAVAAALANRVEAGKEQYHIYAAETLKWLRGSGLLTSDNTFLDGRDTLDGCKLVGPAWTYNQGAILGGLVEHYDFTRDKTVLNFAHRIAHGTIDTLTDSNGILTEDGYPEPLNEDRAIFKGIFLRNLSYLQRASPNDAFVDFIRKNADAIAKRGRAKNGLIGPNWQGPLRSPSVATQAAAIDCFIAAATVIKPEAVEDSRTGSLRSDLQNILHIRRMAGIR